MNSPRNPKQNQRPMAVFYGFAAGLGVFLVVWWTVFSIEKAAVRTSVETLLHLATQIMSERNAVFQKLKEIPVASCNDQTLSTLRANLVSNRQVGDIVVFAPDTNTIRCSAVAGLLSSSVEITGESALNPKYPGRKTWLEVELNFLPAGQLYHLVRERDFGLVLFPASLRGVMGDLRWSLITVNAKNEFLAPAYGDATLYDEFIKSQQARLGTSALVMSCAHASGSICVIGKRSFTEIWQRNILGCILGLLFSTSVAIAVFLLVSEHSKARSSEKGRVLRSLALRRYENFRCVYQPIVCLRSGATVGCEVLARFEDEIGPLPPNVFVPLISAGGSTWKFTEIIVTRTLRELSRLDCPPGFRVAFNFYPKDLEHDQLEKIKGCAGFRELRQRGFQLVCEILETGIGEMVSSEETITYLKSFGFKIAIDDFGTGTSNLKQLKEIRPDYLKIDKSFVDDIGESDGSYKGSMIPHIIAIAKEIGTEVVVEGVETPMQADALTGLGAEFAQGYYYARPLSFEDLQARMAADRQQSASFSSNLHILPGLVG